jgi:succinate dehydrogenase/fumarate reductase flavoprotein subunit
MSIDRRTFLKGAAGLGVLGAAAGVTGCAPSQSSSASGSGTSADSSANTATTGSAQANGNLTWLPSEPQISDADVEQEVTADVVVIGCGLAGTSAARAAAEEGATVAVFEKADGPVCRSGDYAVINGPVQAKWGRDNFDPDVLVDHEMDEMSYFPKRSVLSKWAKGIGEVFAWHIAAKPDLYICQDFFTDVPDSTECALYPWYYPLPEAYDWTREKHPTYPSSVGFSPDQSSVLNASFQKAMDTGKVTPYWGHFAEKLIVEDGRVTGCYVRNAETGSYVKATAAKGLILATGEYGSNEELLDYYAPEVKLNGVPSMWMNMDVEGNPTNTGDGLKLGAWINAAIQQHHAPMIHWMGVSTMGTAPYLRLNLHGKRFMNEDMPGQQVENQIEGLPGKKLWQFWDSAWPEQVPQFIPQHGGPCYVGAPPKNLSIMGASGFISQEDIDAAVEEGQVLKAETIDALLDAIGEIDKAEAQKSITRYNELAKAGKDEDFGKVPNRLFPLERGPFYAASSGVSAMLVCCGGLVSDEEARVYDNDGNIIPGIYVAGNIQGSRYAVQYPIALKGVSHSLCLFYGYTAGKNAVAGV